VVFAGYDIGIDMADKNLQFLDIPRADPAKTAVETRVTNFNEIYAHFEPHGSGRSRRAAALPAAIRSASGNARFTTTFPTG
jgi:hypothetical protein